MIVLGFGTQLNPRSWAERFDRRDFHFPAAADAENELAGETVFIDLAETGFADFVTVGQMLIFVQAIVALGATYSVRWPETGSLPGEDPQDPDAAIQRIRRQNCLLYLEQAGAVHVLRDLQARHEVVSALGEHDQILDEVRRLRIGPADSETEFLPHRHRRILPYRWVRAEAVRTATKSLEVELRDLGLTAEAAAALTKGILIELLDNGVEHSGAPRFLLGGAIVQREAYRSRVDDFEPALRGLVRNAAASGSPLVRLVVADAGRGIGPAEGRPEEGQRAIVDALDTWSGAGGAAGLWKVSRIVRAYEGSLLISSAGHTVARQYDGPDVREVRHTARPFTPGTFVQCAVLSRPASDALRIAGEVPTPRGRPADSLPHLGCVAVTLGAAGLEPDDLARVGGQLATLDPEAHGLVVVVKVTGGGNAQNDSEIGRAIRQVLDLVGAADVAAVTMAFPSVNRPLMSVAVEHLNAEQDRRDDDPAHWPPMLVVAPQNRHYWVGGTPTERAVLNTLSVADRPVRLPEMTDRPAAQLRAIRGLNDRTTLVRSDADWISLRVRPQDAVTAMATYVGDRIRQTIKAADRPGVHDGIFLTPSLRVTNRWVEWTVLLAEVGLADLAGFTLAARVEERLDSRDRHPPVVVRLGSAPREMVAAFARSLTGREDYFDSLDDTRLEGLGRSAAGPVRAVLVTDLVSSGTTLTRALSALADREMMPVAAATVVDARAGAAMTASPQHVAYRTVRVPLISLVPVDVTPGADEDTTASRPIDPILSSPEVGRLNPPHTLIPQQTYIDAVKRNAAARLGHIERPADRHYSVYVDPTLLFREQRWARRVTSRLVRRVQVRHGEVFGARAGYEGVCLLYPEGTADDVRSVAERIAEELWRNDGTVVGVVAVPRATYNGHWWLPQLLRLPPNTRHAVIVDAGASSGHTLQQMIRLAAHNDGVDAITGILLVNGLGDSDALNLQQIASVRRTRGRVAETVPLEVFAVARTAMRGVDAKDCTICALRRRYSGISRLTSLPELLRTQRDWLVHSLEPRTKQALFEEQATDLLGANVSQGECVEYLQWRFQLREAALNVIRRREVVAKLAQARSNRLYRDALIRLLVAESQWLRSAPLSFPDCRESLADLVLSLLTGDDAVFTDQIIRVQAVILLANAAPDRFAGGILAILRANRRQQPVVVQALLETLRLIVGPASAATSYARDAVTQPLLHRLMRLESDLRSTEPDAPRYPEVLTSPLVRYLLSHGRRPLQPAQSDMQGAWSALRDFRGSVAGHDYSNAMWRIVTSVGMIGRGHPPADLDGVNEDWTACLNFLQLDVLPNTAPLRPVLMSRTILHSMSPEDGARWEQAISGSGGRMLDTVTVALDGLLASIQPDQPADTYAVDGLLADLQFWSKYFLLPKALLPTIINRCPADLIKVLRESLQDAVSGELFAAGFPPADRELWVFCTTRVLRDAFTHVRMNADEKRLDPDTQPDFQVQLSELEAGQIRVVVRNTGTSTDVVGGGQGLDNVSRRLANFGAVIEETDPGEPWTYAVAVTLHRWRMAI